MSITETPSNFSNLCTGRLSNKIGTTTATGITVTADTYKTPAGTASVTWNTGPQIWKLTRKTRTNTEVEFIGVESLTQTGTAITTGAVVRYLSMTDGTDLTSQGNGLTFPAGTIVELVWSVQHAESTPFKNAANIFAALQTFSAGIDVTGKYIKSPVFADETARDAAITSPANGMVCYVTVVGLQFYSGGSWNTVGTATVNNASTTVAGIIEISTSSERGAGTAIGGTGAALVVGNDALVKTSSGAGDENKIAVLDSTGKFASGFINTTALGIPTVEDTELDSTWDNDTAVPTKNVVHDAFKDLILFPGSEVLIAAGTSASQQNFGTYQKRKEVAMKCKGTVTVQMSVTISGGAGLRSRIYKNGVAVGTERSGSGSWDEDITVVKGDLLQIYQHDSSTNFPHSVTAFNILVSSVYGVTVLL